MKWKSEHDEGQILIQGVQLQSESGSPQIECECGNKAVLRFDVWCVSLVTHITILRMKPQRMALHARKFRSNVITDSILMSSFSVKHELFKFCLRAQVDVQ